MCLGYLSGPVVQRTSCILGSLGSASLLSCPLSFLLKFTKLQDSHLALPPCPVHLQTHSSPAGPRQHPFPSTAEFSHGTHAPWILKAHGL